VIVITSSILIIDDEEGIRKSLTGILKDEKYEVDSAASGEEGLAKLKNKNFDLVLLDIWLPGLDGIEILREIKKHDSLLEVVIISGHGNVETAVKITKLGAFDFIEKPLDLEKTMIIVRNALKQRQLQKQIRLMEESEDEKFIMIGESSAMKILKDKLERSAPTEGRVLIFGENGTGKELAARLIHRHSKRSLKPFVAVNCAAIPEELIESEMFGHKKGAFTGADSSKIGKFEQADGGTLFLDEVGDMSFKTQAKVLRVLEEGNIQPVGDIKTIAVDVRVIAATNKNLEEEIAVNNFRKDLFFRLSVIPINIPPLRERTEDLPLLIGHYQEYFSAKYNTAKKTFLPSAMKSLQKYDWPGNVRELKNMIERIFIMHPGAKVDDDIIETLFFSHPKLESELFDFITLKEAMDNFEKKCIMHKLKLHNHNITETAEALGIERTSLYRKLKKFDVNGASDGED
jgi:two-component system nitrogen regulation response regulator NtrX